jgi:hypothetical protein
MLTPGIHNATVYHNGEQAEQFAFGLDAGGFVLVNGPQWSGFGALQDKVYVGCVKLKHHDAEALHRFTIVAQDHHCVFLNGIAICRAAAGTTNETNGLRWVIRKATVFERTD